MMQYSVSPTLSLSAYSSGDILGGALELKGAAERSGWVISAVVFDDDGENEEIDFFFFSGALAGTYTDNAAFAINANDKSKLIGVIKVEATDYIAAGSDSVACKYQLYLPYNSKQASLYVIPVVRGTPTFTAATDLRFDFGVLWD